MIFIHELIICYSLSLGQNLSTADMPDDDEVYIIVGRPNYCNLKKKSTFFMLEVDIEVSETDHSVSDINLPLICSHNILFSFTDGYHYALSLFIIHDKELIPSYVDFLELYDWPPGYNDNDPVSECIATESKSLLERWFCGPGYCSKKC